MPNQDAQNFSSRHFEIDGVTFRSPEGTNFSKPLMRSNTYSLLTLLLLFLFLFTFRSPVHGLWKHAGSDQLRGDQSSRHPGNTRFGARTRCWSLWNTGRTRRRKWLLRV